MQWATLRTLVELLARVGRHAEAAVLHGAMTASPTALVVLTAPPVEVVPHLAGRLACAVVLIP